MTELQIDYERTDRIGVLNVHRPPVNALRYQDLDRITNELERISDEDILTLILQTGGEDVFIAGHEVGEFLDYQSSDVERHSDIYDRFTRQIYNFPMPIACAIDGSTMGAGSILLSLCDILVAKPDVKIGLPEIRVGIVGGYHPLKRVLPENVVRYMMYTGEPISSDRAYELGMVSKLSEEPTETALEVARKIASYNPQAVLAAREVTIESQPGWPVDGYQEEREYIRELRDHPNAQEAARAFIEDRDPQFE